MANSPLENAQSDVRKRHTRTVWRDALETVINSRKLSDALVHRCTDPPKGSVFIAQSGRQEQLYALLKNKRKVHRFDCFWLVVCRSVSVPTPL